MSARIPTTSTGRRLCNGRGRGLLGGRRLRVSAYSPEPFLYADRATGAVLGGAAVDTLDLYARHLGFSYDLAPEPGWVVFRPDGSIGGTVGSVSAAGPVN